MSDTKDEQLRVQYGALPYRRNDAGDLEVLLITSRGRGRWIIPKGWPMKGRKGWQTAELEAREEAGVCGEIAKHAAGSFRYEKLLDEEGRIVPCEIVVYPLLVKRTLKSWREQAERELRWVSPRDAEAMAADDGLRAVVASFADGVVSARRHD